MAELDGPLMLYASVQAHAIHQIELTELLNPPFADNEGEGGCSVSKQNMEQTVVQLNPGPFHQTDLKPSDGSLAAGQIAVTALGRTKYN